MGRDEAIAAGMSAIQQGCQNALGGAYDQGKSDQAAIGSNVPQQTIDQAVADALAKAKVDSDADKAAALAALQSQLDAANVSLQGAQDGLSKAQAALADSQSALAAMTAKEQLEEQAVADVQTKLVAAKDAMDKVLAIVLPQPAPAPAPAVPPAQ